MKNKWKILFFVLAIINLMVIGFIYINISLPVEDSELKKEDPLGEHVQFHIQTNKSDLNQVINQYLQEQQNNPLEYQVSLDEYVNLFGMLSFFNQEIEMKITFEPVALTNGDLLLQHKSMHLGRLQLPAAHVLNFIKESYQFPNWVIIQPQEENVYVNLQKIELKSDFKVRVNEFDLKNDQLLFTLLIPTKKGASK